MDWSFIAAHTTMKTGKQVCKEFIDGILYPQSIGELLTKQELTVCATKAFIGSGLVLRKITAKKAQSYFKKSKTLSVPYFCKLDDRCYDFTVQKLDSLKQATRQLQTELLKLDVTCDYEGCFFIDELKSSSLHEFMKEVGFEIRRDYNQIPTCVCFKRNDVFVTIYNKVV